MDALFVFTRFPQAGCTKTRLIPALGKRGAADLQKQMTEYLLDRLTVATHPNLSMQVQFTGGTVAQMEDWIGSRHQLVPQADGDLGDRLTAAFKRGFTQGLSKIVIIGSDCPSLEKKTILEAITLLDTHDVVLGPAADGGYYLIGLSEPQAFLFQNIPWSTEQVLGTTKAIAAKHSLSVALLDTRSDIDRPEDLPLWYALHSAWKNDLSQKPS